MNEPYNHDEPESRFVWLEEKLETVKLERDMLEHKAWDLEKYLTKKLEELKLERDALWVKTQEDEREINDLRDINKQLREKLSNYFETFENIRKAVETFKHL